LAVKQFFLIDSTSS